MLLQRRIMQLQRRLPSWCVPNPSNLSLVIVFALAYITVRAYILKMIRQHRAVALQLDLSPSGVGARELSNTRIFAQLEGRTAFSDRECPLLSLEMKRSSISNGLSAGQLQEAYLYGSCKRVPPVPGSCDVARKLFFSSPPESCSSQNTFVFCHLAGSAELGWKIVCNATSAKACLSDFYVGVMDQRNGQMEWTQLGSLSQLSSLLNKMIHKTSSNINSFGFVFIKCMMRKAQKDDLAEENDSLYYEDISEDEYGEQLLILPPHFARTSSPGYFRNIINVNILFIDSVSNQHFYRSLNASVAVLEQMLASSHHVASVFDFELVQAVRSRTFESLQSIFAGSVDTVTEPFNTQGIPPEPLRVEAMLGGFREAKYRTLWLEDLCHTWEWGLPKDLHFMDKGQSEGGEFWERMWQKLRAAQIDDVGPTLAMCRVLEANFVRDHFHGPDAVCFNGRHQHEYLLDYLLLYQQAAVAAQQPVFTFAQTNVGHEGTGKRIQTLDQALALYIDSVSHLSNTLTIILSDHGNTYGAFVSESEEAQREIYHPAMFFIVPNRVARILGKDIMHALKVNTKRLVSFQDLHKSLLYLQNPKRKPPSPQNQTQLGLFSIVDASRTCNDIPRIKPNLCICEDFEVPLANDTEYNLLAYFAIGRLNDEIQRQSLRSSLPPPHGSLKAKSLSMPAFSNCEKLVLNSIKTIKKSTEKGGSSTIKMELLVQMSQVFFVSLTLNPAPAETVGDQDERLKLQTYERLTAYSQYTHCAEADQVWPSLCVCAEKDSNSPSGSGVVKLNDHDLHVNNDDTVDRLSLLSKTNKNPFYTIFDIDVADLGTSYTDVKEDIQLVKNNASKNIIFKGRIFSIPQYQDYVSEKVLPGFRIRANFLKSGTNTAAYKSSELEKLESCLLLVWTKHRKGVVLSVANTCRYQFSVLLTVPVEKERKVKEASCLLYTASSPSNAEDFVLMPRGTWLLAVLWGRQEEDFACTSVHLKLRVRLNSSL